MLLLILVYTTRWPESNEESQMAKTVAEIQLSKFTPVVHFLDVYFDILFYLFNNLSYFLPSWFAKTVHMFFLTHVVTHTFHLPEFQIFCYHDFEAPNYVLNFFLRLMRNRNHRKLEWMHPLSGKTHSPAYFQSTDKLQLQTKLLIAKDAQLYLMTRICTKIWKHFFWYRAIGIQENNS